MPFRLIAGTFHVVGYSPDGDSIRFRPDDTALIFRLPGGRPSINDAGDVQLRIEGIDALETHYQLETTGRSVYQPERWADAATGRLLEFLGIEGVEWRGRQVGAAEDEVPGWILSRTKDKYGRPVAFVFAGEPPEPDGASLHVDPDLLRDSYNHVALAEGLAYPTYYSSLFWDLREEMTRAVTQARDARRGLWPEDVTNEGFAVEGLDDLTETHIILPKLFRRLSSYVGEFGSARGFKQALEASREPVLSLPNGQTTHLDTFVEQDEGSSRLRLSARPEDLVFDPMPARPDGVFAAIVAGMADPWAASGLRPSGAGRSSSR